MNKIEHIEFLIKTIGTSPNENDNNGEKPEIIDKSDAIKKLGEIVFKIGEVSTQIYNIVYKKDDLIYSKKVEINSKLSQEEIEYYFKYILNVKIVTLNLVESKVYKLPKEII